LWLGIKYTTHLKDGMQMSASYYENASLPAHDRKLTTTPNEQ